MASSEISIPSYLSTPPTSKIDPPVATKQQELPFEKLSWEDFEKLCLRLARLESNVEHCQLYGTPGQKQEGIDIYARQRLGEKYKVYQCKRVNDFGPKKIQEAVTKFIKGAWVDRTDTFILCTKESLVPKKRADEVEKQAKILKDKGIKFNAWDSHQLSHTLKGLPQVVDDFFGRSWVSEFCGLDQAEKFRKRLDKETLVSFRKNFGDFYKRIFNSHDPGLPLPIISAIGVPTLTLENRFILPDIYNKREINIPNSNETPEPTPSLEELYSLNYDEMVSFPRKRYYQIQPKTVFYRQRLPVEQWLTSETRNIILGGPGSGKSTFLRYLAIDLLQETPKLNLIAQKWGDFLPVWLPFAFWTKAISSSAPGNDSLSQIISNWLKSWDEERLCPLIDLAIEDERLFLLVDGLDEWTNETAAQIALQRLHVFIERRNIPAIVTSRPHGFTQLGMQQSGWQIGELCDFNLEQQKQLSWVWFNCKQKAYASDPTNIEKEIARKVDIETESFTNELKKVQDLRELAKIPLLLCLLISLKFHNVRLPQNRFKAYDQLTEFLISTHPQKRRVAAGLIDSLSEFTNDDLKNIFSYLAYFIQTNYGEGVISSTETKKLIEDYLKDANQGLGLESSNARKITKIILEFGENTSGLIVKKTEKDFGFYHRAFQEYLAAYYISSLPLEEHIKIIQAYSGQPQWHEVLLGLFHINNRPTDIEKYIQCIKSKTVNTVERYTINLLLSEIAFGDFNCSTSLAREIAKEIFGNIETETWMPQRERLLLRVLDGLRSTKVKELVKKNYKAGSLIAHVGDENGFITKSLSGPKMIL